jgi:hypothetical protein
MARVSTTFWELKYTRHDRDQILLVDFVNVGNASDYNANKILIAYN